MCDFCDTLLKNLLALGVASARGADAYEMVEKTGRGLTLAIMGDGCFTTLDSSKLILKTLFFSRKISIVP